MEVKRIDNIIVCEDAKVRVKEMGNITEIMYSDSYESKCSIKKIDKHTYMDLRSGEVKEFKKMENRACDIASIRKTLGRLRDYLNTNITDVEKCKWVTLTYQENMVDTEKLYNDFKMFNRRLRKKIGHYEYIVAMEPQSRGAWHCHVVMIFKHKAPFICNDVIWKAWSPKGFKNGVDYTKTQKLDDVDNVGAYLTAYMADMDVDEGLNAPEVLQAVLDGRMSVKEVEVEVDGNKVKKSYLKGARLYMYPTQFNLYRCSRGIKKPKISYDSEKNAQKKVSAATLTYQKSIQLIDQSSDFKKVLDYRYYNSMRK